MFLRLFFLCVILLAPWVARAQKKPYKPRVGSSIVDDSTKSVYGPQTSKWTTEEDIFYNRNKYQPIDTSIINYHRWTYVQRFNNFYKDLGNVGTAMSPIFPLAPTAIGVSSGFNSFDPYYTTAEPKYYDTKSPYSRMFLVWGGNGRAMTQIEFSRNINPRWNFGFSYRPILVDKQIQRARKGDRQTISNYYDGYTSYKTKDDKYSMLFSFRRIRHRLKENGGVDTTDSNLPQGIFDANAKPSLTLAESRDLRTNFHLFHQYKAWRALQVYHSMDRYKQLSEFFDLPADTVSGYFKNTYPAYDNRKDTVFDKAKFKYFQNEFGVKGSAAKLFYNFYYKIRHYSYSVPSLYEATPKGVFGGNEHYLGGRASIELDSLFLLSGWTEFMSDGNYRIEAKLNTPWLDAQLKQLQSKPGFMQTYYYGGHDYWLNDFTNTQTLNVNAFLKGKFGPLFISPGFNYTLLSNYIFFKQDITQVQEVFPMQSKGNQHVVSPEVRMEVSFWKKFYLRPTVIYTRFLENADDALSIPRLFVNTQLTFEGFMFKKNLMAQIGFDFHWQSDYYALGYSPSIQQFYVQNQEMTRGYPLVDVFINGKIKRGKFFIKYHNLLQTFTSLGVDATSSASRVARIGYIPTPGYPGQRNILDFGFEILLFD